MSLTAPEDWLTEASIDHLMGYFTYARGFKGGGFNAIRQSQVGVVAPEPFGPEQADNFEVGFKTIAFDQRLTANLALFYMPYDDIQASQFDVFVDPDTGEIIASQVTRNAAKATSQGVELEVVARPVGGLMLTGSLGYLDARYDEFENAQNQLDNMPIDRAGESFQLAPKWQSFLAAQYSFPLEVGPGSPLSGWLTPRVEWAYRDRYFIVAPEIPQAFQRGYNIINARLSYDFLDDRAQVALWGRNLLDEEYFNSGFATVTSFGNIVRYYEMPRTWGGEISYSF